MSRKSRHTDYKVKKHRKEDTESKISNIVFSLLKVPRSEKVKEKYYRKPYGKIGEVGACYAKVSE